MVPILITIVQGNQGFNWNFTLTDSQSVVVDLTGASLFFDCQLSSDFAVHFKNAMVVVNPTTGTCRYTVQANDFLTPGIYYAQISVEYNNGEIFSYSNITIEVQPLLPVS